MLNNLFGMNMIYSPVGSIMGLVFFGIFCVWVASLICVIAYQFFKRNVVWFTSTVTFLFVFCSLLLFLTLPHGFRIDLALIAIILWVVIYVAITVRMYFHTTRSYISAQCWWLFTLFSFLLLLPRYVYGLLITLTGGDIVPVGLNTGDLYPVDNFYLRLFVIVLIVAVVLLLVKKFHRQVLNLIGFSGKFEHWNPFVVYFNYVVLAVVCLLIVYVAVYLLLPAQWFYIYKPYYPPESTAIYGF